MSVNAVHSGRKKKAAAPLRQSGVVLSSFPGQRLALTAGGQDVHWSSVVGAQNSFWSCFLGATRLMTPASGIFEKIK